MRPFLVVGLPRSRTAWLARFLTYEDRTCTHEPSLRWTEHADLKRWLALKQGASDSMMTWLVHEALELCPELAVIVIRRDRAAVIDSIKKLKYPVQEYLPSYLAAMDRRLDEIEDYLPCYSASFDWLVYPQVCGLIFRKCLEEPMPPSWWKRWKDVNVQASIPETLRVLKENEMGRINVYGRRHWEKQHP